MQKFRPYLSTSELSEIVSSLKQTSGNLTLIRNLESYLIRANTGIIESQYTPKPRQDIETKLGFKDAPVVDLQALKLAAFNRWSSNPTSCTVIELSRARMYRYEHDLMSEDEEKHYEREHFIN